MEIYNLSITARLDGFASLAMTNRWRRHEILLSLNGALDEADRVYNGINASIDKYIANNAIPAPPPSVYTPPWRPAEEPAGLDLEKAGVTSIVWCIGFHPDFRWLDAPVFNDAGQPQHRRGVTPQAGLYFLGLPWLHTWGSGRFSGVARDAKYLSEVIQARMASSSSTPRPFALTG